MLSLQLFAQSDASHGYTLLHPSLVVRRLPSRVRLHAGGLPDRASIRRRGNVLGNGAIGRDADTQYSAGVDEVVAVERRVGLRRRGPLVGHRVRFAPGGDERKRTWRQARRTAKVIV